MASRKRMGLQISICQFAMGIVNATPTGKNGNSSNAQYEMVLDWQSV